MEFLCPWESPIYLIFSSNVPTLLYYSHFVAIIAAILFGFALLTRTKESLLVKVFLAGLSFFILWTSLDVLLWAINRPDVVLFYWNLQILLEMLLFGSMVYFTYLFIMERDLPFAMKLVLTALILPVVAVMPTPRLLSGVDLSFCTAIETQFGILYPYAVQTLFIFTILFLIFRGMHTKRARAKEIAFSGAGVIVFLLAFSSGNIIGSITDNWELAQVGLFGMPVFIAVLTYTAVRFKTFNLKLIGAQTLIIILWVLTLSLLFIRTLQNIRLIVVANLVLFTVLGYLLIRSVKKEIEQREHVEHLARELEKANRQQIILIHFITHQIKGFVTKSRNIFSMLLEGDYGSVPDTMRPMVEEGLRSDTKGANTIQEILNAANIKSGKVTYTKASLDLRGLVEGIVAELKPSADAKGIRLAFTAGEGIFTLSADRMQLVNAVKNLIDNSIKYTPSGSVEVSLTRAGDKLRLVIKDTGVGITPEDMKLLFTEGGHGKESQKVNVESTGFGLYIVKNIIEAHQGRVWAESEGKGTGSRFIIELPVS